MKDAPALAIRLFGAPSVDLDGVRLSWDDSRKATELLAFLCLHAGRRVDRETCAGLLWPDSDRTHALGSLRHALLALGQNLKMVPSRLSADRRTIAIDLRGASLDLNDFDSAIRGGDESSLHRAIDAYRGPLLEGWTNEWICQPRLAREQAWLRALERLAAILVARSAPELALPHLQRVLLIDPLRESACANLMRIHAAGGRYIDAMRAYQEVRARLNDDLGVEPGAEVREAYAEIRRQARAAANPQRLRPAASPPPPDAADRGSPTSQRNVRLAGVLTIGKRQTPVELQLPALPGLPESGWQLSLSSVSAPKDED